MNNATSANASLESAKPNTGQAGNMTDHSNSSEPVFVFGSSLSGVPDAGDGALALAFHGAIANKCSGMHGNSYAVPIYDRENKLLPLNVIANYINGFLLHSAGHGQMVFQVNRFACGNSEYKDAQLAALFGKAGANCRLPGLWVRHLEPESPVRIIVHDPDELLCHLPAQQRLDEYFAANLPLWGNKPVEIVSAGQPKSMVANEHYARTHNYQHRIIGANQNYYHGEIDMARSYKAIWYATHMVCFVEPEQTNNRRHVRLISMAARGGLTVDAVKAPAANK